MKYYPFLKVYRTLDNYKKIIIIFLYNYIIFLMIFFSLIILFPTLFHLIKMYIIKNEMFNFFHLLNNMLKKRGCIV